MFSLPLMSEFRKLPFVTVCLVTLLYCVWIHMKIRYAVMQPKQPSRYVRAPTLSASSKMPLMWFTVCSNWLRSSCNMKCNVESENSTRIHVHWTLQWLLCLEFTWPMHIQIITCIFKPLTPDEHLVNFLPTLKFNILDLSKPKSRAPVQLETVAISSVNTQT